jgi:hypothetical protein
VAHLGALPVIGGALRMPDKQMRRRLVQGGLAVVALVMAVAMSVFPTDDFVVDSASSHRPGSFNADAPTVMLTPAQALQTVYGRSERALLIDLRPEWHFAELDLPRVRNLPLDALAGLQTSRDEVIVLAGTDDAATASAARSLRRDKGIAAFAVAGGFAALQSLLLEPQDAQSLDAYSAQERALVKRLRVTVARARPQYAMYLGAGGLASVDSPAPRAGGFQPPLQPATAARAGSGQQRRKGQASTFEPIQPEEGC